MSATLSKNQIGFEVASHKNVVSLSIIIIISTTFRELFSVTGSFYRKAGLRTSLQEIPHTVITVDASPVGISAILAQKEDASDDCVVAYASRALSPVEKRHSQTEKEALSIVWAVQHLKLFIYGKPFQLVTDHKPLEVIYGNPKSKPFARIERWVLR